MKALTFSQRAALASCLALAGVVAQAATGFTVQAAQEKLITPGASEEAVRNALGQPSTSVKYPNEPGQIWTYNVAGKTDQRAVFEVQFAADSRVAYASEHILPPNNAASH